MRWARRPTSSGPSTRLACGGLYSTSPIPPAASAIPSRNTAASASVTGNQSGRITCTAPGARGTTRRRRSREICALMWLTPIWNGMPATLHFSARHWEMRSNSSSVWAWNSPAVPLEYMPSTRMAINASISAAMRPRSSESSAFHAESSVAQLPQIWSGVSGFTRPPPALHRRRSARHRAARQG